MFSNISSAFITFIIIAFFSFPVTVIAQSASIEGTETKSATNEPVYFETDVEHEDYFSQVITAEQLHLFSDRTVEELMARIVGVQRERHGRFNIRGTSGKRSGLYNVTINGQRMATTGKGHRSINLSGISTETVGQLEVIKVLTPDMDADALGGTVNLKTRRPAQNHRVFSVNYGGGFDSGYSDFIRPESSASIYYSETFMDDLSVSAGLSYQRLNDVWERLGIDFDVAEFGDGQVDVVETIAPSLNIYEQMNWNGHVLLNYQLTTHTGLFLNSYMGNITQDFARHQSAMSAGGDWINQFETGDIGGQGAYGYNVQIQDQNIQQYMVQAGANHMLNNLDLEYRIGWSHSSLQNDQIALPFLVSGLDYTIDLEDQSRPVMDMVDREIRSQDLRIEPMKHIVQDHADNTFTGNIDLEIPFGSGFFRIGSGAVIINKDGDYRNSQLRVSTLMDLSRFQMEDAGEFSVLNSSNYNIPWLVKPDKARSFFERNYTTYRRDDDLERKESDIWIYESLVGIYSGYGMVSWDIGLLNVTGGVRVEHTAADYTGNNVIIDFLGNHSATIDTTISNSYTQLFPNLRLNMAPMENWNIMAAYSRSIGRPDFHDLTPFSLVNEEDSTVFTGNSKLEPMVSDNLDLLLERSIENRGYLGLGLFYKNISNFVYERRRSIEGGEWDGYSERTFQTGDETADIYGIEVYWRQSLGFLPGILGNLGTFTNYTWSHSSFDVDYRDDDVRFPGHSPHVINAALIYTQNRFTGQLAYHWTAESIVSLAESQRSTPSVSGLMYRDRYEDGASDLSASVRFRISQNFRLWADATNLLRDERVQYTHSRSAYPIESDLRRSSTIRLGIQFTL